VLNFDIKFIYVCQIKPLNRVYPYSVQSGHILQYSHVHFSADSADFADPPDLSVRQIPRVMSHQLKHRLEYPFYISFFFYSRYFHFYFIFRVTFFIFAPFSLKFFFIFSPYFLPSCTIFFSSFFFIFFRVIFFLSHHFLIFTLFSFFSHHFLLTFLHYISTFFLTNMSHPTPEILDDVSYAFLPN
jgi:hypothetical protein